MSEDDVGFQAPRLPEPGQAHLHGEDGGLGVPGLLQGLGAVRLGVRVGSGSEDNVQQGGFEHVGNGLRAPVHGVGEHRFGCEQLPGHPGVLTTLAGKQPGGLGCVSAVAAQQAGCRPVVGQCAEQIAGGLHRIDHARGAVLEVRPSRSGGQTHVGQRGFGMFEQPGAVIRRRLREGGRGARR